MDFVKLYIDHQHHMKINWKIAGAVDVLLYGGWIGFLTIYFDFFFPQFLILYVNMLRLFIGIKFANPNIFSFLVHTPDSIEFFVYSYIGMLCDG